jgi:hypothetical protein
MWGVNVFDFKSVSSRSNIAHVCMLTAVILLGVGLGQINIGLGLASTGLSLGVYGYLLGAE